MWLSGVVHPKALAHPHMGVMLTSRMGNRPDLSATQWGADNGCFRQPQRFSLGGYLDWLGSLGHQRARCLFATAPDVVGDACATWERSRDVLWVIRELGFPAALVAQDGLERMRVPWDAFDVLFVGGSTDWKLSESAYVLVAQAKQRGKWAHMGRVNSLRRLRAAQVGGCDSADGTFLARSPDVNYLRACRWLRDLEMQRPIWDPREVA